MSEEKQQKEKPKRNLKAVRFVFFILLVFLLSGAGVVIWDRYLFPYLRSHKYIGQLGIIKKGTENVVVINKTEQINVTEDQSISPFTGKAASSVVEILSKSEIGEGRSAAPMEKVGSGLVVTADGLIVTYKEAILSGNAQYKILSPQREPLEARLLTTDSFSNLAILKIDGISNLPVAEYIAPSDIKVGAKVVVIGRNGFDADATYQYCILSEHDADFSLGGPQASSEKLQGVYFLDADFGKYGIEELLGGPVVDYNGNVVGMLGSRKDGQENKYFVIPVDIIQSVEDLYIQSGNLSRGSLGVYYALLSKESPFFLGTDFESGAMVYTPSLQQGLAVLSGSAAQVAGLRLNDVILSINGEEISASQNLAYLISKYKPGEAVDLKISREGREMEAKAELK